MKTLYFLILLILSFNVVSAQEILSKEEQERRAKNVLAGNPFAKYGSKAPVATLTNGKYLEVHDLDSIVTIGRVRWHVKNQQIVGRIIHDPTDPYAQPIGDAVGRWISPDPLSEKMPNYGSYVYTFNNPINFVDPTGMIAEPPTGVDANDGAIHTDSSGSWKYNKATTTWMGQNGAKDLGNTIALNNVNIKGYKKTSYYQGYFDTYKYIDGKNPYSPYIPDATGFSTNVNINTGLFGEFHGAIGIAIDRKKDFAFFGSYGGNIGYNGTLALPKLGCGLSFDMYDNYGGNTGVLDGLRGTSTGYTGSLLFGGTYSKSAESNNFGFSDKGVETKSFDLKVGFNAGFTGSNTIIFYNSKNN
ncbi:hypothetical protein QWY99_07275 [Flavobacterium branchiarum]|uniref:RHS repeat-associated core domain-containing protein n=1 Tax=Flavobacterium branchiarum TaxID=1114870 RepID=A0ABV5FRI1_9FLAO|nr:hypothetical protein [Flavobacterium branchiarum]MDN3672850.1 hypothetical protein [Flavobacterium branchiarum]